MKIGFIGLGTMGGKMATNLQKAGHDLVVNDLREEAVSPHLAAGATWADTPREIASQVDLVFTSLPGPPDVELVALGEDGLLAGFKPGSAYFDLSTNSPTVVRRLHATFAERGVHLLDAPVSGGPAGARSGKLAIWVGGDEDVFNRYKSVLDAISDSPLYIGPIGAGSVTKLVHNCAGFAVQAAVAEVLSLGVKAGVEPLALWGAIRQGINGRSRTFDRVVDHFLPGTYEEVAFALRLAHKDVTLATDLARELHVPMRLSSLALDELTEGLNRGWGELDCRAPMQLQLERAGVEIKVDRAAIQAVIDAQAAG